MQGWLFTIEEWQKRAAVGDDWGLWTEPPLDQASGGIRRRSDGEPYTPAWKPDDCIVVYHPQSGRCVALLEVTSHPNWSEPDELFYLDTRVIVWDETGGPTLAEIGVVKALQGGRHRLNDTQLRNAQQALASSGSR